MVVICSDNKLERLYIYIYIYCECTTVFGNITQCKSFSDFSVEVYINEETKFDIVTEFS